MHDAFRNKTLATLLAFVGGAFGAPWLYLRRPGAWWAAAISLASWPWLAGEKHWYQHPAFFVAALPVIAGFIYALVLALMPDERFDARYNPRTARRNQSGWPVVLLAVITLLVGATVSVTVIVLGVQTAVEASL